MVNGYVLCHAQKTRFGTSASVWYNLIYKVFPWNSLFGHLLPLVHIVGTKFRVHQPQIVCECVWDPSTSICKSWNQLVNVISEIHLPYFVSKSLQIKFRSAPAFRWLHCCCFHTKIRFFKSTLAMHARASFDIPLILWILFEKMVCVSIITPTMHHAVTKQR